MTEQSYPGPGALLTPAQIQQMIDNSLVPINQQIAALQGAVATLGQTQIDVLTLQSQMTAVQGSNTNQDTQLASVMTILESMSTDIVDLRQDLIATISDLTTTTATADTATSVNATQDARLDALEAP